MGVIGAEQLAQAKERAPDVRLDSAKRQGRLARDFFVRQAPEEGERDQLAGQRIEVAQGGMQAVFALYGGQEILRVAARLEVGEALLVEWFGGIAAAQGIERAASGDRQYPGDGTAAGRVEAWRLPPDLPEGILGHLLGGLHVPGDAQRQPIDASGHCFVEFAEGLLVLTHHAGDPILQTLLVGERSPRSRFAHRWAGFACRRRCASLVLVGLVDFPALIYLWHGCILPDDRHAAKRSGQSTVCRRSHGVRAAVVATTAQAGRR